MLHSNRGAVFRVFRCLNVQIPPPLSPKQRTITTPSLVHLRYLTRITDNGFGKRYLVSLRPELSKNAF